MILSNRTKSDAYKLWFSNRIVKKWNIIPLHLREIEPNANGKNTCFKYKLREWLTEYYKDKFTTQNICSWFLICECSTCKIT
jgi:hypothetical protein